MMTIYPGIFFFSFVTSAFYFIFFHSFLLYKKKLLNRCCMYVWSGDGIWLIEVDLEHQSKVH